MSRFYAVRGGLTGSDNFKFFIAIIGSGLINVTSFDSTANLGSIFIPKIGLLRETLPCK
jgi:hypothetical protein